MHFHFCFVIVLQMLKLMKTVSKNSVVVNILLYLPRDYCTLFFDFFAFFHLSYVHESVSCLC